MRNSIKEFIEERCEFEKYSYESTARLYSEYEKWCAEHNFMPVSFTLFTPSILKEFSDVSKCKKRFTESKIQLRGLLGITLR
jgi:hypothetical protein